MSDNPIQDAWVEYAKSCIPQNAPIPLRIHLRRSFFIGAQAVYVALLSSAQGTQGSEDDQESHIDINLVEAMQTELKDFFSEVQAADNFIAGTALDPFAKPN